MSRPHQLLVLAVVATLAGTMVFSLEGQQAEDKAVLAALNLCLLHLC